MSNVLEVGLSRSNLGCDCLSFTELVVDINQVGVVNESPISKVPEQLEDIDDRINE